MNVNLNFEKPTISAGVIELLLANMIDKADIDSLKIIAKGNKLLQKGPANGLLISILKAMNLEDSSPEDEITPDKTQSEEEKEEELDKIISNTLSEETPASGSGSNDDKKSGKVDPEKICHFYTANKCKFGKDCRKQHPKICLKFKKSGLKKFNKNGCEMECTNFHPKACFESMKTKTCQRMDCKFYHLSGTKKLEMTTRTKQTNFLSKNTFNTGERHSTQESNKDSAFYQAKAPWEIAIEKMAAQMQTMMNLQQMQLNNQENQNFERNNWRATAVPTLRPQQAWLSQSQSQNVSQSQGPYGQT